MIPSGTVATYGQIAAILGNPNAARAVGQALRRNPHAPVVPCHRVVGADGHLCGFSRGLEVKEKLLRKEGVEVCDRRINLSKYLCGLADRME